VRSFLADLAILLIDASAGVLVQTKRHARICALMGIRHFVFAVNKMDLVGYSESRFREIEAQIGELLSELNIRSEQAVAIPVSATEGDNITKRSDRLPWYKGPVLLPYLETVDVSDVSGDEKGFYLPIQRVCRPNHEFRGFQGQIEHGELSVGDTVRVLPGKEEAHVKRILVADHEETAASAGQPVTVTLDREVDVSRGCVLEKESGLSISDTFQSEVLWMDDAKLSVGKNFLVRIGTRKIPGIVTKILYQIDVNTGEHRDADHLSKNEIAVVEIAVTEPVILDVFSHHRAMGELILIDRISNMTSACGVVTKILSGTVRHLAADRQTRSALNWQAPCIVSFRPGVDGTTSEMVDEAEFRLVRNGRHTYAYHPQVGEPYAEVVHHLSQAGLIVLLTLERGADDEAIANEENYHTWASLAEGGETGTEAIAQRIFAMTNASLTMNADNWVI
jgi:sulfate adenylyltransferase subunit 1